MELAQSYGDFKLVWGAGLARRIPRPGYRDGPSPFLDPLPELTDPGVTLEVERADFDPAGPYDYWEDMLDAADAGSVDTIVLAPGDYTDIAPSAFEVGTFPTAKWISIGPDHVGSADRRRVIRAAGDTPPWEREPEDEVLLHGFHLGNTSGLPTHHWVLHNITLRGGDHQNSIWQDTYGCVLDQVLIDDNESPYAVRVSLRAHDNTIQRSIMRQSGPQGSDGLAVQLKAPVTTGGAQIGGPMHNNKLIACAIVNYNDAFGITVQEATDEALIFDGTVVDDCDFYLTPAVYVDADGDADPDGPYARAENAVDLKGGSSDPENPVRITFCRMHGYRYADQSGGPSGSDGVAMTIHFGAANILFEDIAIWDCAAGIRELQWVAGWGGQNDPRGNVYHRITMIGIRPFAPEDTGYCWKTTVPTTIEDSSFADCAILQDEPPVQVGENTWSGNRIIGTPLGEAADAWAAGDDNAEILAADAGPAMITVDALTDDTLRINASVPRTFTYESTVDIGISTGAPGSADLVIGDDDDVAEEQGLETAILLSLFLDRRAEPEDQLTTDDGDRRGWWADEFAEVQGDKYGSRLWLLDRAKLTADIVPLAEAYDREALAWMVADRVVERIDVKVERIAEGLLHTIDVYRPGREVARFRFGHAWDSEVSNAV